MRGTTILMATLYILMIAGPTSSLRLLLSDALTPQRWYTVQPRRQTFLTQGVHFVIILVDEALVGIRIIAVLLVPQVFNYHHLLLEPALRPWRIR
jgi:hypothetical protein